MSRRGWVLFVVMGVLWGLPYLLIRVSVREVSPAFLVLVRTAGGALLLAPFVARRGVLAPLLAHWKPLVAYTVAELCVPWWLLFTAEKKVSSSLAGLLVAAVPIAGAVIARATGSDRLDRRRAAGLLLGLVGVAALVGFDVGRSDLLAASSFLVIVTGYALGPWILAAASVGRPRAERRHRIAGAVRHRLCATGRPPEADGGALGLGAGLDGRAGGGMHGRGFHRLFRLDRRGGPDAGHGHYLHKPGGRRGARRNRARGEVRPDDGGRLRRRTGRQCARHRVLTPAAATP